MVGCTVLSSLSGKSAMKNAKHAQLHSLTIDTNYLRENYLF